MQLLSYETEGRLRYGALVGEEVIDLSSRLGSEFPTLLSLLETDVAIALKALNQSGPKHLLSAIRLLKPLSDGSRIFCVGLNYPKSHPLAAAVAITSHPTLFMKTPEALVPHEGILFLSKVSSQHDYEGELVVVIGRPGRAIAPNVAMRHIAGYTCMNDGSVRDYQAHSLWAGKNFFRSGSLGPWITTSDQIADPAELSLRSRLNGEEVQHTSVGKMFFNVQSIIAYLSTITPLRAGDMIATGSPSGSGSTRAPQRFLAPGDRFEVEIDRIGILANTVGSLT